VGEEELRSFVTAHLNLFVFERRVIPEDPLSRPKAERLPRGQALRGIRQKAAEIAGLRRRWVYMILRSGETS